MWRFTIRDLLLVMVCVSLAAGWWMDRRCLMAQNRYLTYEHTELQARYKSVKGNRDELLELVSKFQEAMQVVH